MTSWMCGSLFGQDMKHHESVQALWELEWKKKCTMKLYPFHFARVEDMQVIIDELVEKGINDAYDDKWTETFIPHMKKFEEEGQKAEVEGHFRVAEDFYLRGSTLGMISRFPIIDSPVKRESFAIQKRLYLKGTSFWTAPVQNVYIPHKYSANGDADMMQVFLRRPPISSAPARAPVLLINTGLDGYRTDSPPAMAHHAISLGFAVILMEVPGTGDAAGNPSDPASSERQLDTVLDWIRDQEGLDEKRILLWGTSTGGYNAMRAAHTHHDRISMAIAHGGASDKSFSREWLDKVDGMEYATGFNKAFMIKLGYKTIEEMKENAQKKFSLVENGIFDGPSCRLLLTNGMNDTIFPIEDTFAPLMYGGPKEARIIPDRSHMGEPQASGFVRQAMERFAKDA